MKQKKAESRSMTELRRRAEDKLKDQAPFPPTNLDADREHLIHEMDVRQTELEIQNEELKRLRNEAEELAAKYIDIYDFAPLGYVSLNPEGVILQANLTAASMIGKHRAELIAKPLSTWINPAFRPDFREFIKKVFLSEGTETFEAEISLPDQSARWVQMEARLSPNNSECRLALIDVTARRKAEELLLARQKQLEDVNRELESFSYSVSHDLQTPLRAIDGFSRMILRHHGGDFDEETKREFDVIRANVKQMGQLITDLLAFSRLGKRYVSVMPVDVQALFQEAWDEQLTVWPGRAMTLTMADLPPAYADLPLIKQVITNLLANAVKFSQMRNQTIVEVSACVEDQQTVYCVKDNGVGFDMAYIGKLFGMFQTLHDRAQFEGTGVGLAIAQRIIFRHGGKIWAEGEPERGATFCFSLPHRPTDMDSYER